MIRTGSTSPFGATGAPFFHSSPPMAVDCRKLAFCDRAGPTSPSGFEQYIAGVDPTGAVKRINLVE
jgi:hypothetical protein